MNLLEPSCQAIHWFFDQNFNSKSNENFFKKIS